MPLGLQGQKNFLKHLKIERVPSRSKKLFEAFENREGDIDDDFDTPHILYDSGCCSHVADQNVPDSEFDLNRNQSIMTA